MKRSNIKFTFMACLIAVLAASLAYAADGFTTISKDQLKEKLGNPDVIVIDVRTPGGWSSSEWKIQGTKREDPTTVKEWMGKYPQDKTIVLYCA